jgi:hypothetical protein
MKSLPTSVLMRIISQLANVRVLAVLCVITCVLGKCEGQSGRSDAAAGCDVITQRGTEFDLLASVCEYALASPRTLPNFVCKEHVKRYVKPNQKPDVIAAELTIENVKSHYDGVTVNGKPKGRFRASQDAVFEEEAVSTGEFAMLFNIFDPVSRAEFLAPVDVQVGHSRLKRYDFRVQRENNVGWTWFFMSGATRPGYHGSVFVEPDSGRISRLFVEVSEHEVEAEAPVSQAKTTLDYGDVRIKDAGTHLVPIRGETVSCFRQLLGCIRFELSFDNFHKFGATTRIVP